MEDLEQFAFRSFSPALRNYLSPLRSSTRPKNYEVAKKRIASINKSLFNSDADTQPILRLEKAAMKGVGVEKQLKNRIQSKNSTQKSNLEQILQKEHKVVAEGTQIVKLPKLPYGHHHTYNEERDNFYGTHFISTDVDQEASKDLRDLNRKYKLNERIKSKRSHSKSNSEHNSKSELVVYKMECGQLYSVLHKDILESYEEDKSKYVVKHHYAYQTFRKIETINGNELDIGVKDTYITEKDPVEEKLKIKKKYFNMDELVKRLYKPPEKKKNALLGQFKDKYLNLFSDESDASYQLPEPYQ